MLQIAMEGKYQPEQEGWEKNLGPSAWADCGQGKRTNKQGGIWSDPCAIPVNFQAQILQGVFSWIS